MIQTTPNPPRAVTLPWRVIVDTAETHAFTFTDMRADSDRSNRPIVVDTVRRCLGRYPRSYGDYSLEAVDGSLSGFGYCQVERKSLEDCQSTLLGFGDGHRERFESELANLKQVIDNQGCACVVVECDLCELVRTAPAFGRRSAQHNAKTLMRSVLALQQDYRVPWLFAGGRRMAEQVTFRFLERWWRKQRDKLREVKRREGGTAAVSKELF